MFNKTSFRTILVGMIISILILLTALSLTVFNAVNQISTAATEMGNGKDIVADILPPPLYIIEAELTIMQLQDAQPNERPALIDKLTSLKKDYDDRIKYWQGVTLNDNIKQTLLVDQKTSADKYWDVVFNQLLPAAKENDQNKINDITTQLGQLYAQHREKVNNTVKVASAYADNTFNNLQNTSNSIRWLLIIITVTGYLLCIIGGFIIVRQLLQRLGGEPAEMQFIAQKIADGDLTIDADVVSKNDGSLLASIVTMQSRLRTSILESRQVAAQLQVSADKLADGSEQVSRRSAVQHSATSSAAASVEEISVSMSTVTDSADTAHELANHSKQLSANGKDAVQQTVQEINEVASSVSRAGSAIEELGKQSQQISAIVSVIKDIAEQTNLLALNAAIEAARAGEQGRGFAVVADEVRKLAERTTRSTQEIVGMISTIQQGSMRAVAEMTAGNDKVSAGVIKAEATGAAITTIEAATQQVLLAIEGISLALKEQTSANGQIARNIEEIARMSEENDREISSISQSALGLRTLADKMQHSVNHFKV